MNKLSKQTDLKHSFILLYFGYMWRTLPPFYLHTVFLGPNPFSENSLFFLVCTVTSNYINHNYIIYIQI